MTDKLDGKKSNFTRRGFIRNSALAGSALATGAGLTQAEDRNIKALLVTGGGHHDYKSQKSIITEGTEKLLGIDWEIWHHQKADDTKKALSQNGWSDPYDIIVYNICHAHEKDADYINNIVETHKKGKPCAVIHCTMHSYHWGIGSGRNADEDKEWNKLLGVVSLNHGPRGPAISVKKSDTRHSAYKHKQVEWSTPKGELYNIDKVYPSATVLANGNNGKKENPVIWVNQYEKANVFATTLGHHNETMDTEDFLQTLADGMTWAVEETNKEA